MTLDSTDFTNFVIYAQINYNYVLVDSELTSMGDFEQVKV